MAQRACEFAWRHHVCQVSTEATLAPAQLNSRFPIPIPSTNHNKHIQMNKTRLENGRGVIPNTLERPLLHASLDSDEVVFYITGKLDLKNRCFNMDSRQSQIYNMLQRIIGSFHGFGEHGFCLGTYESKLGVSVFPYLGF